MKKRIGFIGCGEWARKKYLPYLSKHSQIEIASVSNLLFETEEDLLAEVIPGSKFFKTYEEMIKSIKLDGVIITLPHNLHFDAIKYTLNEGIPTLVDKPLCTNHARAKELVDYSKSKKVVLGVCSQRRAHPGIKFINSLIKDGKIGELFWFDAKYYLSSYKNWKNTWRNDPLLSGEPSKTQGLLLDTGYHMLDAVLYMINYRLPNKVYCSSSKRDSRVDYDSTAVIEFANELRINLSVSRGLPEGNSLEKISVLGDKAYAFSELLELNNNKMVKIFFMDQEKNHLRETEIEKNFVLEPLIDFINHLDGADFSDIWSAENTLPTLRVMDALYQSIISGNIVNL